VIDRPRRLFACDAVTNNPAYLAPALGGTCKNAFGAFWEESCRSKTPDQRFRKYFGKRRSGRPSYFAVLAGCCATLSGPYCGHRGSVGISCAIVKARGFGHWRSSSRLLPQSCFPLAGFVFAVNCARQPKAVFLGRAELFFAGRLPGRSIGVR